MSNLVLIESIIKNLDAKETRTAIMLANDRLTAMGESPVQEVKKQGVKSNGGYRGATRPYNVKTLPLALGDFIDDVKGKKHKTFRDLDLKWANLEPTPSVDDGTVAIVTVGGKYQKKHYLWGIVKEGLANFNCKGHEIPNFYNMCNALFKDTTWKYDMTCMPTSCFTELQLCIDDMERYRNLS